ncbi:hypothetical protein K490DRAFT_40883 [Saccharata proteae CBS 121410]|uniref:Zn(2)-C6 fungal-type domain-containing protein n=1 Tax=Saccharata proteae CBS 121410 TaxID=1314787 RepID=A0A9P4HXD2_9PEZI|nr:hypothetical protein K490DRAFT_40883 [Saccharata proteae CBS 121410]
MKCDEVKPVCGPCAKGSRPCVYNAMPKVTQERASLPGLPRARWNPSVDPPQLHGRPPQERSAPGDGPQPQYSSPQEEMYSPQSTLGSGVYNSELASLRWFGLLADDADKLPPVDLGEPLNAHRSQATDDSGFASMNAARFSPSGLQGIQGPPGSAYVQPFGSTSRPTDPQLAAAERKLWQSTVTLREHEIPIFKHYIDGISQWMDMFDPSKHFSTLVPQLAMQNEGLMKALLALSSRHLSIKPATPGGQSLDRTTAINYYHETLQYLQGAMRYESYTRSLEVIPTAIVVSAYEMIDGAGSGWERHLKGVFWIQRSRDINGQSGGLEQAGWWCWLRQDIWAAFRERRKCLSFYKPTRPYHVMDQYDIASRSVYLLAQTVNYASDEERKMGEVNLQLRIERADTLLRMLDDWRANLTVHFNPLPHNNTSTGPFKSIWINPPAFATAVQMHNFARILLLVHQPAAGGYREYFTREKLLNEAIDTICGIGSVIEDEPASFISTQCLFAAGLYVQDDSKKEAILELIDTQQRRTRWPVSRLTDELRAEWAKTR